nr:MAG TPA: hypothetical protein [Caudoviricetes sp.]
MGILRNPPFLFYLSFQIYLSPLSVCFVCSFLSCYISCHIINVRPISYRKGVEQYVHSFSCCGTGIDLYQKP